MGADFLTWCYLLPDGKEPVWDETLITDEHIKAYQEVVDLGNTADEVRYELKNALTTVQNAWADNSREGVKLRFSKRRFTLLLTGGMSWGDSPTELFDAMQKLYESGLAEDIGFEV